MLNLRIIFRSENEIKKLQEFLEFYCCWEYSISKYCDIINAPHQWVEDLSWELPSAIYI